MKLLYLIASLVLAHLSFVGGRMTTTLFALRLGADEFTVGVLMALYALVPMLLSVSAGRLIDRVGTRRPLLIAHAAMAAGTLLPWLVPRIETLYLSSTLIGTAFLYLHVAMNSVIGAIGRPEMRAVNFSWLALGFSTGGSFGPLLAGYSIDWIGHARAFALLALFPVVALAMLALLRNPFPQPERAPEGSPGQNVFDLLRIAELRRTFVVSGLLAMGWDLYGFLMPIYGARIGLTAATIGVVMATFAAATFAVRLVMPMIARRLREWAVIAASLFISGATYLMMPFVSSVPLLMTLSFALGVGLGSAQPLIMAILYNTSPPGRQGEVVGVRTLMLNASHTIIPPALGAVSAALGMAPAFVGLSALLLAGSWFAHRLHRARRRRA